jgi:hypothetical protein
MKRKINILLVGIFCIGLSGCYESVVRFWNNDGWEPPPAKKKLEKNALKNLNISKNQKHILGLKKCRIG